MNRITPDDNTLKEIQRLLIASVKDIIESEEKEQKERKIRDDIHKEMQRQKYLESLTPISKEEFALKLKALFERYKNFIKYRNEENILFCSLDLNFADIIKKAKVAKSELELAEILDNAEKTMHDLEGIKNIILDKNELNKEIEKRKKEKLLRKQKLFTPLRGNLLNEK